LPSRISSYFGRPRPQATSGEAGAELRAQVRRLEIRARQAMESGLTGQYQSAFRGLGLEFEEVREYRPEDDIRYIDWNVTARMNTPYVRQYMEDREITAWFLVDLSPSMDFGTVHAEKRGVLIDLVGTLGRLLTRHGNRVGAILYSGQAGRKRITASSA